MYFLGVKRSCYIIFVLHNYMSCVLHERPSHLQGMHKFSMEAHYLIYGAQRRVNEKAATPTFSMILHTPYIQISYFHFLRY